jgi:hypothetical protein
MKKIADLFDSKKDIYRTIEKVITYNTSKKGYSPALERRLKSEISEYVVTDSIESQFENLLMKMNTAMEIAKENDGNRDAPNEIGVWVSGFYGSGKSSFTKYFGLAFDEQVKIEEIPFAQHLQNRLHKPQTKALLSSVTKKYPASVVMLDLASDMLTGATMEEVSTVLYYKVLQWAGYSQNLKIAALERKIRKEGRFAEFEQKVKDATETDKDWAALQNDENVWDLIPEIAHEMYPKLYKSPSTFTTETKDIIRFENTRVEEMLNIIRETTDKEFIIFVIDEVGHYVGARPNLILNLDGLAKNLKNIGEGKVWILSTAQQTLTVDDRSAAINSLELYKLKDRFPIAIDLKSTDIREICYRRLLEKSSEGEKSLGKLFDKHGQMLRHNTKLDGAKTFDSDFNKESFINYYPFLPSHFDILLHLLGRLASSTGGIGLRSAIKVVQDILIDEAGSKSPMGKQSIGNLVTTVILYDALEKDIRTAFPSIRKGVEKAIIRSAEFEDPELIKGIAKTVAILQILENIVPVTVQNIASLMHPSVESPSRREEIIKAIDLMTADKHIPFGEQEGDLCFFSEKLNDIEQERSQIPLRTIETRRLFNKAIEEAFSPLPQTRLHNTLAITAGLKVLHGSTTPSTIAGEGNAIQILLEFVDPADYENARARLNDESRISKNNIYVLARKSPEIEEKVGEIYRSQEICRLYKNDPDKEVIKYCKSQETHATILLADLQRIILQSTSRGSFIFQAQTTAVDSFDSDTLESCKKILAEVAARVYDRYSEAPHRAETGLAEKFLRLGNLAAVNSQTDPLSLVKIGSGGTPTINTEFKALVSIHDYIEQNGSVDGRTLMDHFTSDPFGWAKDTLRYLVAALLYSGEVRLTVSGHDVTVPGQHAIDALKTNNSFNPIGVSLRDTRPSIEVLARASKRLTDLIAESVIPLENDISKAAIKHLPQFQSRFGPLCEKLKMLDLTGAEKIDSVMHEINDIILTDASDVAVRLGSEESILYTQLMWANEVDIAFKKGLENTLKELQGYRRDIQSLPQTGIPGQLVNDLAEEISRLNDLLSKNDFHKYVADFSTILLNLKTRTRDAAIQMAEAHNETIHEAKKDLSRILEWADLTQEEQLSFLGQIESCKIIASQDLQGLKTLLNQEYVIQTTLNEIKKNIVIRGKERQRQLMEEAQAKAKREGKTKISWAVNVPKEINTIEQIDGLIRKLQDLKREFTPYSEVEIRITLEE